MAVVQAETLNLRAGPGTGHSVVATAKQGDELLVAGRNTDSTWLEVSVPNGQRGWVSAPLVQLSMATDQIVLASVIPTPPPTVSAAPTLAPSSSAAGWVRTRSADCDTPYEYPATWLKDGVDGYRYEPNHAVIWLICADAPRGDQMTSQGMAFVLAEEFAAAGGWSKLAALEFFTRQGKKYPVTVATFSMQLSNGDPAQLLLATVPISQQRVVTVVAIAQSGPEQDLAAALARLVTTIGAD